MFFVVSAELVIFYIDQSWGRKENVAPNNTIFERNVVIAEYDAWRLMLRKTTDFIAGRGLDMDNLAVRSSRHG